MKQKTKQVAATQTKAPLVISLENLIKIKDNAILHPETYRPTRISMSEDTLQKVYEELGVPPTHSDSDDLDWLFGLEVEVSDKIEDGTVVVYDRSKIKIESVSLLPREENNV